MKINSKLKSLLAEFNIPYEDGLAYLLCVYYKLNPSYIPDVLIKKILFSKVFEIQANGDIVWHIPLYEGHEIGKFEWVKEFRALFAKANKTRSGTLSTCVNRMKTFFAENPDIRKEEVMGATELYLKNVSSPEYVMKSHKFIFDGAGVNRNSTLELWVEIYRERNLLTGEKREGHRSVME